MKATKLSVCCRHFDRANTNTIVKAFFGEGENCRAFVVQFSICTAPRQISLPLQLRLH